MLKVFCIVVLFATVYGIPVEKPEAESTKDIVSSNIQSIPPAKSPLTDSLKSVETLTATEEIGKLTNEEVHPKNEKEVLEGAEFGWGFGFRGFGWGYPYYGGYYPWYGGFW